MKLTFLFFILTGQLISQILPLDWTTVSTTPYHNFPGGVACDNQGNVITATTYEGILSVSGTTLPGVPNVANVAVIKRTSTGQLLWVKPIVGPGWDYSYGRLAVDAQDNIYVTGGFAGDTLLIGSTMLTTTTHEGLFVVKYDTYGNVLWAKGYEGLSGQALALDKNGNIFITGALTGTVTVGADTLESAGLLDNLIMKLDSQGNAIWARSTGGVSNEHCRTISIDAAGDVYIGGNFWQPMVAGSTTMTSYGSYDPFFFKYDANGNFLYGRNFGSTYNDYTWSMGIDSLNNVYLAGNFSGQTFYAATDSLINQKFQRADIYIVKYDSQGNLISLKGFGGSHSDYANGLYTTQAGDTYITGYYSSPTIAFGTQVLQNAQPGAETQDAFLLKCDSDLNVTWVASSACPEDQYGMHVTLDKNKNVYLTGGFESCVDWGQLINNIHGKNPDVFLAKFSADGNLLGEKDNLSDQGLQVFPNPASDRLIFTNPGSSEKMYKVVLYDMTGKKVKTSSIRGERETMIMVEDLPPGVYAATIESDEEFSTIKVVISRD